MKIIDTEISAGANGSRFNGAPLDIDRTDLRNVDKCISELGRQLRMCGMPVVQVHFASGLVHQLAVEDEHFLSEMRALFEALSDDTEPFAVVAVPKAEPLEDIVNILGDLVSDTAAILRGEPTSYCTVNELQIALQTGHAGELIVAESVAHRRWEISQHVGDILALDCARYPELPRIQKAAVAFLFAVDSVLLHRAA